ncbi:MAG: PH domain-containing protein [Halobacteria archaeon]|nr:PH domain-containing protein [Halobacteria archaeon]
MRLHLLSIPYRSVIRGIKITSTILAVVTLVIPFTGISTSFLETVYYSSIPGFALGTVWQIAYHFNFDYELSSDVLSIKRGVMSRRNIKLPVNRIQNIDLKQSFLLRILGLSAVSIKTAGSTEDAKLRYLGKEQAKELRDRIRNQRGEAGQVDERTIFTMQPLETWIFSTFSIDFKVMAIITSVVSLLPILNVNMRNIYSVFLNFGDPISLGITAALWLVVAFWATGVVRDFSGSSREAYRSTRFRRSPSRSRFSNVCSATRHSRSKPRDTDPRAGKRRGRR